MDSQSVVNNDDMRPLSSNFAHPGHSLESSSSFKGLRATPASSSPFLTLLEKDFVNQLRGFMDFLRTFSTMEAPRLGSLITQVDFNYYYTRGIAPNVGFIASPVVQKVIPRNVPSSMTPIIKSL